MTTGIGLTGTRKRVDVRLAERVQDLCRSFTRYAETFDRQLLFEGPSLYFHLKSLSVRSKHGGSVTACLADDPFLEALYATLTAWGSREDKASRVLSDVGESKETRKGTPGP